MPRIDRAKTIRTRPERPRVSSQIFALAAVALLSLSAVALNAPEATATHNSFHDSDVYVSDLRLSARAIVNESVTVTAFLTNQGTGTWGGQAAGPVRVCFVWVVDEEKDFGSDVECTATRMQGNGGNNALVQQGRTSLEKHQASSKVIQTPNLRPGESTSVSVEWTPSWNLPVGFPQNQDGRIGVMISQGTTQSTQVHDQGPFWFPVSVMRPGVSLQKEYVDPRPASEIRESCASFDVDAGGPVMNTSCRIAPGQLVAYALELNNTGNRRDTFRLYHTEETPDKLTHWNVTFAPDEVVLAPGASRKVLMVIQAAETGETAEAGHTINARSMAATASAEVTVSAASGTDEAQVSTTFFPSLLVRQAFNVNMTALDKWRPTNVSQPMRFNFSVGNPGNGPDTYHVEFVPDESHEAVTPSSWRFEEYLRDSFTVQSRQDVTRFFIVEPPRDTPMGRYPITLRVVSEDNVRDDTSATATFNLLVLQTFNITGDSSLREQFRAPADPATYELTFENNGNGDDVVTFEVDREGDTSGWTWDLEPRTLELAPRETGKAILTVTPPRGEEQGRRMYVNVTAYSSGPDDLRREERSKVVLSTLTHVKRGANFEITGPTFDTPRFIDPGQNLTFNFRVRNLGNVWDNVTLSMDSILGWGASVEPEVVTLVPPESRVRGPTEATVTVTLSAPSSADVGDQATIDLRGRSEVDTGLARTVSIPLRISGPDLAVSNVRATPADGTSALYAGDTANVTVSLQNLGNRAPGDDVLVRLYYTGASERIVGEVPVAALAGGTTRQVTFAWDLTGLSGAGELRAVIDEGDGVVEIDETNNERILSGDATFVRTFDVRVTPAAARDAQPGERVRYITPPNAFVVENHGNRAEPLRLALASREGWTEAREETISLAAGDVRIVELTVDVPEFPGVGEDKATLVVTPTNRPGDAVTASVSTRVVDDTPPTIRDVRVDPEAPNVDQRVTISADVRASLGVKAATAVIATPLNDTIRLDMEPGEGDTWFVEHAFRLHGAHRLYVEAVDDSANENTADTRTEALEFTVTPGSAPTINVLTDLERPIRAGAEIEIAVDDPAGVSRTYYVMNGQEHAIPGSGRLDTSAWSQGNVDFTVVAENIYGVKTSERLTAVVDNTPPEAGTVVLDPARPRAGEELTLRITVDPEVDAVEVVVKRDGEEVERLDATRAGEDAFTLTYTPESGAYDFEVVLVDAAGNTRRLDEGVTFTTSGQLVPAPGVLVALVALGALAVVARPRRR